MELVNSDEIGWKKKIKGNKVLYSPVVSKFLPIFKDPSMTWTGFG